MKPMNVIKRYGARIGAALASTALVLPAAHAQIDTSTAVAAIGEAGPAIVAVGGAVFLVVVAIAVWKWLRRSV